jgi:hypothetical protein
MAAGSDRDQEDCGNDGPDVHRRSVANRPSQGNPHSDHRAARGYGKMSTMTDLPTREDLLAAALRREHVVVGMARAQDHLARVVEAVESSANTDEALRKVRAFLDLDKGQAMAVLDMQVRRMSGTERARVRDELHQLRAEIEQLRSGR